MTPEEETPWLRPEPPGCKLTVWTIYDHPADYREGFVLRAHFVMDDGAVQADTAAWYADQVDKLRIMVPPDRVRMTRHPDDDPAILETWI